LGGANTIGPDIRRKVMSVLPTWANYAISAGGLALLLTWYFTDNNKWLWYALEYAAWWNIADAAVDIARAARNFNWTWWAAEVFWLAVGFVIVHQCQKRRHRMVAR
jgi:hypothetical protein